MRYYFIILCLTFLPLSLTRGQGVDPTLAGMILNYTELAKKQYKTQGGVMAGTTTQHIWLTEKEKKIYNFQKEFNDYLESFNNVMVYAAECYGLYIEVSDMVKNINACTEVIASAPANGIALALAANRNHVYYDIMETTLNLVSTISSICSGNSSSSGKMTEKERIEMFFTMRPQIAKLNKSLCLMTKLIKYTTLSDVWNEILNEGVIHSDHGDVARMSLRRWRNTARSASR